MRQTHSTLFVKMCRIAFYGFLVLNVSISPIYPAIQVHAATYGALIQLPDLSGVWHSIQNFGQTLFTPVPVTPRSSNNINSQSNIANTRRLKTTGDTNVSTVTTKQPNQTTPSAGSTPVPPDQDPVYAAYGTTIIRSYNFDAVVPIWQTITPTGMGYVTDFKLDLNDPYHRAWLAAPDSNGNVAIWTSSNLDNTTSPSWQEVLTYSQMQSDNLTLNAYQIKLDPNNNPYYVPVPLSSTSSATQAECAPNPLTASIALDPTQSGHIRISDGLSTGLSGTDDPYQCPAMILDSTDNGADWTVSQLPLYNVFNGTSLTNGATSFVLTGPFGLNLFSGSSIFSPSGQYFQIGKSWDYKQGIVFSLPQKTSIGSFSYIPSQDDGNWRNMYSVTAASFGTLAAVGNQDKQTSELWLNTGGGWSQQSFSYGLVLNGSMDNSTFQTVGSRVFVQAVDSSNVPHIYSSSDGINWSKESTLYSVADSFAVDPCNINNEMVIRGGGLQNLIYSTTNAGATWQPKGQSQGGYNATAIMITRPSYVKPPCESSVILPANAVAGSTSNAGDMDADGEQQSHPSVGGPIDPVTGNYSYSATDLNLPASGGSLTFHRTYSVSRLAWPDEGLGAGWTDNFNIRLFLPDLSVNGFIQTDNDKYTLQESNGSRQYFESTQDGVYTPEPGFFANMVRLGLPGNYTYTIILRDHTRYQFNNLGMLTQMDHLAGPGLTGGWNPLLFTYDTYNLSGYSETSLPSAYVTACSSISNADTNVSDLSGLLLSVFDNSSLSSASPNAGKTSTLYMCYDATSNHHLITVSLQNPNVTTPTGSPTVINFTYDSNNNLLSASDLHNQIWTYSYAATGISTPVQSALLTQVNDPANNAGETQTYTVDGACSTQYVLPVAATPTQTSFTGCVKVLKQTHGNGAQQTTIASFAYTDGANTVVTDGNGNATTYSFNGSDPFTQVATASGVTETLTHDTTNTFLPVTISYDNTTYQFSQNNLAQILSAVTYAGTGTRPGISTAGSRQAVNFYNPTVDQTTQISYQLPSNVVDAAGNSTSYSYQDTGHGGDNFPILPTAITRQDVLTPSANAAQSYNLYYYTQTGWLAEVTDPTSVTTLYTYYPNGQVQTKTLSYVNSAQTTSQIENSDPTDDSTVLSLTHNDSTVQNFTTLYQYDYYGRLTDVIDQATGRNDTISYTNNSDKTNTVTTILNTGNSPSIKTIQKYDDSGRLLSSTNADSYQTIYNYDTGGRLTQIQRQTNASYYATRTYTYDQADNVSSTTTSLSASQSLITVTCYDMDERPQTILQNAASAPSPYTSNYCGNITLLSPGYRTTITYDNNTGKPQTVTTPFYSLAYSYDSLGRTRSVTKHDLSKAITPDQIWQYDYDLLGNVNQITDPANNVTWRCYNMNGQLIYQIQSDTGAAPNCTNNSSTYSTPTALTTPGSIIAPQPTTNYAQNLTTFINYDGLGRVVDSWDALDRDTHSTYDALGRIMSQTVNNDAPAFNVTSAPDGAMTQNMTYTLGSTGGTQTVIDYLNRTTVTTFDLLGRTQMVTVNQGGTNSSSGNVDQNITTAFQYNGRGEIIKQSDPALNPNPGFNNDGSLTGALTAFVYDGLDRLTTVTDPNQVTTATNYDDMGNVVNITGPDTLPAQFVYDNLSHLISTQVTQNGGGTLVTSSKDYSQYFSSHTVTTTDALGTKTRYSYDAFDRLTSTIQDYTGGPVNSTATPSANDTDLQTSYTYDSLDRLLTVQMPLGVGGTRSYKYDSASRVNEVDQANGSNTSTWLYNYDPVGRQLQLTDPMHFTTQTTYNNVDDVKGVSYSNNTADNASFSYSYSGEDKNVTMISGGVSTSLQYDALGQLIGYTPNNVLSGSTFTYNADGQRTSTTVGTRTSTYAYCGTGTNCLGTASDALTSVTISGWSGNNGKAQYTYNKGHQVHTITMPNGIVETLGYDANNRLNSITYSNGSQSLFTVSYTIDNNGNVTTANENLQAAIIPTATPTNTNTATPTSTNTPTNTATATPSPTLTATPIPPHIDSAGIFRSSAGAFYLRLHNTTGNPDITVNFSVSGKPYPVVGDWTGAGYDAVGVVNQNTGVFTLCTSNNTTNCANSANQISFTFGNPNDTPLAGRWGANTTHAGIGVYRSSNGIIYLKNALTTGSSDYSMVLGNPGDQGITGDWTGKNFDSPGVYRPSNSTFYLSNQVTNGNISANLSLTVTSATSTDTPIAGDWIGQGHDGVGTVSTSSTFRLKNSVTSSGAADNTFTYGNSGDIPIAGHWQASYPPVALLQQEVPPVPTAQPPVPPQSNPLPQAQPVVYQPAPKAILSGPTSTPTASMTAVLSVSTPSAPSVSPDVIPGAPPTATLVPLNRVISYKYDKVYRLTGASYVDNGTPSYNFSYGYDLNGNRTNVQESAPNQPTQSATYVYNANNTLKSATINGAPYNYQYDPDGNLQVVSTTGGTWTANYTYDSASRLKQANAGNLHTSYTYDGFNNRISQTNTVSGTTTNYLVDPSGSLPQLLGEFPSGSGPSIYYIPGLGQDVVPAGQNTGTLSYFNTDGLGSVRQMTNNTGNLTYAANFDPYGGILNANILPGATNLGYTGAPTDPSGLVYLNARFYNPAIGSFQSHDPLEGDPNDPASFNGYAYAGSNPTTYSDPSGKCFTPLLLAFCFVASVVGEATGAATSTAVQLYFIAKYQQPISRFNWDQLASDANQGGKIGLDISFNVTTLGLLEPLEQADEVAGNVGWGGLANLSLPDLGSGGADAEETSLSQEFNNGINSNLAPIAGTDDDLLRAAQVRAQFGLGPYGRNVGFLDYDIENGPSGSKYAISATNNTEDRLIELAQKTNLPFEDQLNLADFVALKFENERLFDTTFERGTDRFVDSEAKLLDWAAGDENLNLQYDTKGAMRLYTERYPCNSCGGIDGMGGVIKQFRDYFPNIDLQVVYGTRDFDRLTRRFYTAGFGG